MTDDQLWCERKARARAFVQQDLKKGRAWADTRYDYRPTLYRVQTSNAVFGVEVEAGLVVRAAPIAKAQPGEAWTDVQARLAARGPTIKETR